MKSLLPLRIPGWARLSRPRNTSILGLALDGHRVDGVVVRRSNGSVVVGRPFSFSLSLDLLKDEPSLVGRELRKHLDAAGIRERRCAVALPLHWSLTLTTPLPELPEADLTSYLDITAERGFPYHPEALIVGRSRYQVSPGNAAATLVAVPRDHVVRLENTLRAAQLRPASFSLGITALQPPEADAQEGVVALSPGEASVALQITANNGVTVLRTIDDAFERDGVERRLHIDHVLRELRITLGQLPHPIRGSVRRLKVIGHTQAAAELITQLAPRLAELDLHSEQVTHFNPGTFKFHLPPNLEVSPHLGLALRHLDGDPPAFEFLPPRLSAWHQFQTRYPAGRVAYAGAAAGAVVSLVLAAFLVQQWQLVRTQSRWNSIEGQVAQLESMHRDIQAYKPWFDESFPSLSVLHCLTDAFPEQGSVTAKTIEIHPGTVVCTGTAFDNQSFLETLDRLRASSSVASLQVGQIRGNSPIQFTISFQWAEGGRP
jgi:hypothetical protein